MGEQVDEFAQAAAEHGGFWAYCWIGDDGRAKLTLRAEAGEAEMLALMDFMDATGDFYERVEDADPDA